MGSFRILLGVGWLVSAVVAAGAQATAAPAKGQAPAWRQKVVDFTGEKALMGMPELGSLGSSHCSTDGITYFNVAADTGAPGVAVPPQLYSVSESGEVKRLRREVPPAEYVSVSALDFFAAEHTLVTLFGATKEAEGEGKVRMERSYFLSTSDHDGSGGKLIQLDVKFRPLKIALFGTGEFLVLGWDEYNLLPVLVILKDDGTVRRFVDLDSRPPESGYQVGERAGTVRESVASARSRVGLETLQRAVFVPFDRQVMLTYPGTAKGIRVLSAAGQDRTIPIELPSGYMLHDVLASSPYWTIVVRVQETRGGQQIYGEGKKEPLKQRLFEMSASNGSLLREFLFTMPEMRDVTCAAHGKLTAIFEDAIPDSSHPAADGGEKDADLPTQFVIASVLR